jgi:hypothetical protein
MTSYREHHQQTQWRCYFEKTTDKKKPAINGRKLNERCHFRDDIRFNLNREQRLKTIVFRGSL